jgi:hypothetical protein
MARTGEKKKALMGKSEEKRPLRKRTLKCEDDIKMDLKEIS